MENYSFALADEKDIPEIKAINEECLPENYELKIYQQLIKSTLICRDKKLNKIAGYAIMANLQVLEDILLPFSRKSNGININTVLFSFAVRPEYRKQGIGSRLLKLVCDSHKKYPIILYARKSNEIAKSLYTKYGFAIYKEVPNYYRNPEENGLILVLLKGKNKELSKYLPK